ncbi:MAG: HNH endonuclease signature motif containing protein [Acidimicrobiales bacterium]
MFAGYLLARRRRAGRWARAVVAPGDRALDKADVEAGWVNQAARLHDGDALDPETARRMACDAAWRAVITNDLDPEGVTREQPRPGRASVPPPSSATRTCCFPAATAPGGLLHHVDHHAAGGATRLDNLICLCQLHHTLIHKPGWQITGAPGALVFIRPDGSVVGRAERCPPTQLPPPPPVDPDRRFRACGDRLTTWAHDLLLAHWLSLAS